MKKTKEWIKTNYLQLIIIIMLFVAAIGLFFPYQKATDDYRDKLLENPDQSFAKEIWLDNKDVVNISILENFKIFRYTASHSEDNNWLREESVFNIVIIITLISSIILTTIFAILKKHKLTIVFDVILALSATLMNIDVVERGAMPSSRYTYGISFYLYIVVAIIILICSIIQIYLKKHPKIDNKKQETNTKKLKETKKTSTKKEVKPEKIQLLELLKNNSNKVYISIITILLIIIIVMLITPNDNPTNYEYENCNCAESETFDDEEEIEDDDDDENNESSKKENEFNESSNDNKITVDTDSSGKESNIEYKTSISSEGKLIVFATNKNNKAVDIDFEVEFYDKNNELVGVDYSSAKSVSQKATIALELYNTPKSYKYYEIYIESEESDDYSYMNKLKATHKKSGDKIVVQVKNNTKKKIGTIKVAIVYYKKNKIVGYDNSLHMDIKADRSANFEFRQPYDTNTWDTVEYDRYEVYINEAFTYSWE